ncbi:unnamed protein product [Gulo gulo]|uniref:Uncharacterized protein n=1 Tax=Gulo gulo TaxID=48420 RepID=A0A9X9M2Y1_GULGU|nr:unnamed protein product [Gulo gulo]
MHFYPRSCVPRSQRLGLSSQQVVVDQEVEASAGAAYDWRGCPGPQFPCLGVEFMKLYVKNHAWPPGTRSCSIFPADAAGTLGWSGLELPGTTSAGV